MGESHEPPVQTAVNNHAFKAGCCVHLFPYEIDAITGFCIDRHRNTEERVKPSVRFSQDDDGGETQMVPLGLADWTHMHGTHGLYQPSGRSLDHTLPPYFWVGHLDRTGRILLAEWM